MLFDPAAYLGHVDDLDMPESAKIEMIGVIAAIMQNFVDRAFGDAPEQILLGIDRKAVTPRSADALDLTGIITSTFKDAGAGRSAGKSPP